MFCAPELFRLMKHEEEHGSEYMHTLITHLDSGCSKAETARKLFLHINAFKYRLAKIEQIFGYTIETGENAFQLQLSLKLLRYREHFTAPITLAR